MTKVASSKERVKEGADLKGSLASALMILEL